MKLPNGLSAMIEEEVKSVTEYVEDDISEKEETAYECLEVIDDLIRTMLDLREKDIPLSYETYEKVFQLKYSTVLRIVDAKTLPRITIKSKEDENEA